MQTTQMTLGGKEGCPQECTFIKRLRGSIESIKNALLARFAALKAVYLILSKRSRPLSSFYIFS